MRVGLLTAWASRLNGGVFEAVVAQAAMISAAGAEPVIFALADPYSAVDRDRFGSADVHLGTVFGSRKVGFSPDLGRKLAASEIDLLHLHGIWMATSHAAERWAAETGRPYVISPHGMLDPWITARGRTKKQVARICFERRSWQRATLFHALTGAEAADIERETRRSPEHTVIIPNAITAPPQASAGFIGGEKDMPSGGIVYLGRIHPKKNIDALINAWCLLAQRRGSVTPCLTIAGWGDDADVAALQTRVARVADPRVTFVGPVFGDTKNRLIAGAQVLSLASHSEGLPMVILEAWAAGVPTAMSRHCNLPEGFETGAALDSGTDVDSIAGALATLLDDDAQTRADRCAAARALVNRRFSPQVVREQWMTTYDRLLQDNALSSRADRRQA